MLVPIFPLPDTVLFPRTLVPLHVFEERYRTMTREALEGDRLIVPALLREGWGTEDHPQGAVHEVACLGRIETCTELEDGKYDIVLAGVRRVKLIREVRSSPYRLAEVEELEDVDCDDHSADIVRRRNHLGALFMRYIELAARDVSRASNLVPKLNFETLVNMVASIIDLPAEGKQLLLEMNNVRQRCDVLIPLMRKQLEAVVLVRKFEHLKPGDPSRN